MRKRQLNSQNKACRGKKSIGEKEIISLIQKEASSFVPNDLTAIEKATGTFNPFKERDDLTITEIFHNEGADIVPNLQNKIMAKAGVKKSFSFNRFVRNHLTAIVLSGLVVVGGITAGFFVSGSDTASLGAADGTLVSVSFQSASSYYSDDEGVNYSYNNREINNYIPTFTFQVQNEDNLALKDTLSPCNYSASLISQSQTTAFTSLTNEKAPAFLSRLIKPTYDQGYLEAVDATRANNITITVISSMKDYLSTYQNDYLSSINETLSDSKYNINTYAKVKFVDASSTFAKLSNVGKEKARQIALAYWLYDVNGTANLNADSLYDEDDGVLASLIGAASAIRKAPLSPMAMNNAISGTAKAYSNYKNGVAALPGDMKELKNKMVEYSSFLPWASTQRETIKQSLLTNSYYLVADDDIDKELPSYTENMRVHDGATSLSYFFHVRDKIISGLDYSSLTNLLNEVKTTATSSSCPFPDGFSGEMTKDCGGHHPGEGGGEGGGVRP